MSYVASWSGGKDSCMAFYKAKPTVTRDRYRFMDTDKYMLIRPRRRQSVRLKVKG